MYVQIKTIGGGITNKLYLLKNDALSQLVVVRKFGENTEIFIDRRVETSNTLQLNAYGFGAQLLASFTNGRLESFLQAYTLKPADMRHPQLVPKIARRIAEFHSCNIQHTERTPGLWPTISKWRVPSACLLVSYSHLLCHFQFWGSDRGSLQQGENGQGSGL